jgi:hypothetical protein
MIRKVRTFVLTGMMLSSLSFLDSCAYFNAVNRVKECQALLDECQAHLNKSTALIDTLYKAYQDSVRELEKCRNSKIK